MGHTQKPAQKIQVTNQRIGRRIDMTICIIPPAEDKCDRFLSSNLGAVYAPIRFRCAEAAAACAWHQRNQVQRKTMRAPIQIQRTSGFSNGFITEVRCSGAALQNPNRHPATAWNGWHLRSAGSRRYDRVVPPAELELFLAVSVDIAQRRLTHVVLVGGMR